MILIAGMEMKLKYKLKALLLLLISSRYVIFTDKHFTYAIPHDRELMERVQDKLEELDLQLEEDINELILAERD
jgi:hypothetical protein